MHGTILWSVATVFSLLHTLHALHLVQRDAPAVVGWEIQRKHVANPVLRDQIRRRQLKTVSETLDNEETLYFANITMGTPEQRLRMHLDTGSSDLWVNTPSSELCNRPGKPCGDSGVYNANASTSYHYLSSDFNITYVDGSGAEGDYVTDTLRIGGVTLKGFQFGIGYSSTSTEGVLGIGYVDNEVQSALNGQQPYANLPRALVDAGLIKSNAYSLWLNDLEASTGQILFGGVNTNKFHGTLETLPIVPAKGGIVAEFVIAMTGLSLDTASNSQPYTSTSLPAPVLLDSGSSLSYLPDPLTRQLYQTFQATYDSNFGAAFVPCTMMDQKAKLTFTFSSPSISVGMDELVIDLGPNPDGSRPTFSDGTPACVFGIAPAGDSTPILGDTFLRSAYVVYDLDNNQISLAATNFNSTTDNIIEIGVGKDSVPQATGVSNPVTTAVGAPTGGGRLGGPTGGSIVVTASATAKGTAATMRPNVPVAAAAGFAGVGLIFAAM